jgi:U-box domain
VKKLWERSLIISLVRHCKYADLDPLMYTIMEEPVILPTSKISIDLATIKSHLLSDPTDPFNRSPLKIEDVVPGMSVCFWLI